MGKEGKKEVKEMERYRWVKPLLNVATLGIKVRFLKNIVKRHLEHKLYYYLVEAKKNVYPLKMQEDKYHLAISLVETIERAIIEQRISSNALEGLLKVLIAKTFAGEEQEKRKEIQKEKELPTPLFLTISPTGACNLRCKGCYAGTWSMKNKLDFDIFSKIIEDAKKLWGTSFIVISGGEPLIYKDKGRTIFDIWEKFKDVYFLMYTNGTLIDKETAKKMANLGNVTPAISVEGFEKETDERRGKGVFKKIIQAFENLKEYGVPYGISVTLTKHNIERVMADEFFDFYFEEKKIFYEWIFHYMPIGRGYTLDLMITPEQRVKAWKRMNEIIKKRRYFIVDFWNSGVVSEGCIAAGRNSGYFYINWNGDASPCVFIPYAVHNVYEVYKEGKDLNTILSSEYFKKIREWQYEYAYKKKKEEMGNLLTPCAIRDHYMNFYKIAIESKVRPIDPDAKKAIRDIKYRKGMEKFDKRLAEITKEIWEREYLGKTY